MDVAEALCEKGIDACSLAGGYVEWLRAEMKKKVDEGYCEKVEKSIRTKFRTCLMSRFIKAIKQYELIKEGDKVAVCISGGKDSMLMAKLFQELHRYSEFDFGLEFLVMDPGYNEEQSPHYRGKRKKIKRSRTYFRIEYFRIGVQHRKIAVLSLRAYEKRISVQLRPAIRLQ